MKTSVSNRINLLASKIILSFDTPDNIISTLKIFKNLFENEENFENIDKWGTVEDKLKVVPFSLSKKGLSEINRLKSESKTFNHIYDVGTAGIHEEKYSLLYFFTQYFSVLGNIYDHIKFKIEHDQEKNINKDVTDNLEKKIKSLKDLSHIYNARELYQSTIPFKRYTKEEADKAKTYVISLLDKIINKMEPVKELTRDEEKYFTGK